MDYIAKYIWQIDKFGQMYVERRLKQHNIGPGQHRILIGLYHQDGMSQEEISSFLEIDKAATTKALDKLEAQGYIRRAENKDDRRKKIISLTEKARAIEVELTSILEGWNNILFRGFDPNSCDEIQKALFQIAVNAASGVQAQEKFIP